MRYLLDTNICIGIIRDRLPKTIQRVRSLGVGDLYLCSIVHFELQAGAERCDDPEGEKLKILEFADGIPSLPFDDECGSAAAKIRHDLEWRGEKIGPYDTLIAAIAQHHGLTLVTQNTREFNRVSGLTVENWEALS